MGELVMEEERERVLGLEWKRRLVVILLEEERESLGFGKDKETVVEEERERLGFGKEEETSCGGGESFLKEEESEFGERDRDVVVFGWGEREREREIDVGGNGKTDLLYFI